MKSKAWILYLILNLVLVAVVGYLGYKAYFPEIIVYPDPVTVFEEVLVYGDNLKLIDPNVADASETDCTFTFSLHNDNSEEEKSYYLYMNVEGDKELIDHLTVKIQDKALLINYQPNSAVKKVTLKPNESLNFTVKIYIDFLQVIDPSIFDGKSITLKIIDDQVSFYGLEVDDSKSTTKQDDTTTKDPNTDDSAGTPADGE